MKANEVTKSAPGHVSLKTIALYAAAIIFPGLCSVLVAHSHALYAFPIGLHFLVIVAFASLAGTGPVVTVVAATFVARILQGSLSPNPPYSAHADSIRFLIVIAGALMVHLLSRRSRISAQKLEVALTNLQERTADFIESLHSSKCASWVLDLDSGRTSAWYEGSYPVFGRPFSELENMTTLKPLLHPDDQERIPWLVDQMRNTTGPLLFEHRVPWPNGELHWLEMRANRVPGKRCIWRGLTVDITERKLGEAALLRSEKLAAMGRIASTVAHEINNPLEAVTNLLYLAHADADLSETTRSYLSLAERELARLGNITRLTLGFVRNSGTASLVDFNTTLDDLLSIFHHRLESKGIAVQRHFEPDICIHIVSHELRQIVTNLLSNAIDALPESNSTLILTLHREASTAVLLVEDNGTGIDAANLERIFEPFFSTKEEVGTGIGLWVTKELVEKHSGHITVESGNLGNGIKTRFRLDFPLAM